MLAPITLFCKFIRAALRALASLKLGVAVMLLIAIAIGWATFLERDMGTPVAQYLVYSASWFYALVGVLALNLLCAALARVPRIFRAERASGSNLPFFLAHLGALALILGCWITAERSVKARATIPEGAAVEKAIDVDSRLFDVRLRAFDDDESDAQKIEIPFDGGPLNWRDQTSRALWNADVAKPILESKQSGSFFKDLAKRAASVSQFAAFCAAKLAKPNRSNIFDSDDLKIDVLEYAPLADYAPAPNLKLELERRDESGANVKSAVEIDFPYAPEAVGADPLAFSRRARRTTLDDGARLVVLLADSAADADAFLKLAPKSDEGTDLVAFVLDGERVLVPIETLAKFSQYADPGRARAALQAQRGEIERRLALETARGEDAGSQKPLSTVSRDDLARQDDELRALASQLSEAGRSASSSSRAELETLSQEFETKRAVNALAAAWMQFESAFETSKEFCENLQKMLDQTDARLADVDDVLKLAAVGAKGWRIVAFDTTPTVLQNVEEIMGWTARVALLSPQGERCEVVAHSEIDEHNRPALDGRAYAALWIKDRKGEENAYGRPWSKSLDKPKLEIMQTRDERLLYRFDSGAATVSAGVLTTTPLDGPDALVSAARVELPNPSENGDFAAFQIKECAFQDELGARVLPVVFQKDLANPFYGKVKLRVQLDDATEIFWLRATPIESTTQEQRDALAKKIASSKRTATIALVDKEIDLGVALFVKRFEPTYEPGSTTAASFESVVRILPKGLSKEEQADAISKDLEKDLAIRMNRPGVVKTPDSKKTYWVYQDSFQGPFRPGTPEFDDVVQGKLLPGETAPRDAVYRTILSFNDDPGRGVKYLASLFLVWGVALLAYRKRRELDRNPLDDAKDDDAKSDDANPREKTDKTLGSVASAIFCFFAAARVARADAAPIPTSGCGCAAAAILAIVLLVAALAFFALKRNGGKKSLLILAILAVGAVGVRAATADEVLPPDARTSARQREIDWNPWLRLPVFHDGRRMPLNTFAEIFVRDLVGDPSPTLTLPESTLRRLEGEKPLDFPELESFLDDLDAARAKDAEQGVESRAASREEQTKWYQDAAQKTVARQKDVAERLKRAFPNGRADFRACELLFAFLAEPELWERVPFLDDPDELVAKYVLKRSPEEIAARNGRIAPEELEELAPNSQKTLVEKYRAQAAGRSDDVDKALEKIEAKLDKFRSLVFVPTQGASARPRLYFNKILYGSAPSNGFHAMAASPMSKLDAAAANLERLLEREKLETRKRSPFYDKEFALRRRVAIDGDARGRETLALARQIASLDAVCRRSALTTSGALLDNAIDSTTAILVALRKHRDEIVADQSFSLEYRQELMRAVDAMQEIVDALESAALALVVETTQTLDLTPATRAKLFRTDEPGEAPWLPIQALLWAPDPIYARFLDPTQRAAREKRDLPAEIARVKALEPISPFDDLLVALKTTLRNSEIERDAARAFADAADAYRDRSADDRAERTSQALDEFARAVKTLAERADPERRKLADAVARDPEKRALVLDKTQWRQDSKLDYEVFYYKLNAFYWNWIACLAAAVAMLLSCARQFAFDRAARRQTAPPQRERLFFSLGAALLAAACAIAFLGCAVRALVTGWAPVANMFETVVLLAFLIAAIALGYSTAPIWSRPFGKAWRTTRFFGSSEGADSGLSRAFGLALRIALLAVLCAFAVKLWTGASRFDASLLSKAKTDVSNALAMQGALDALAACGAFLFVAWFAPRFCASVALLALFAPRFWSFDAAERRARVDEIFQRKAFLASSAVVATLVAAAAYFNSTEFNPHIRPLAAVLRSNFWLAIHVVAIIVSYALGAIAWILSLPTLGAYAFGRYRVDESGRTLDPDFAVKTAPAVEKMMKSAVLFLTAGIILGARWADFSWGRFWSWDPKEVWALATLFVYLVVLHARYFSRARTFFLPLGASFGALAILMTWYGLSFVMGGGGRHAYATGESNKVVALQIFFAANVGWAALACVRFAFERRKAKRRAAIRADGQTQTQTHK